MMPWLSLLVFLISFFTSKKAGAKTSTAALIGATAGLATYVLADPANPSNVFGVEYPSSTPGPTSTTLPNGSGGSGASPAVPGLLTTTVNGAADVLKSWGPTGTAAVIGTTAGVANGWFTKENMKWWLLGGAALFIFTRR